MTLSTKSTKKHPQRTTLTHHPQRPAWHTHSDTSGVCGRKCRRFFSPLAFSHSLALETRSRFLSLSLKMRFSIARAHAQSTCRPPQSTHRLRWRPCSQMLNQNGGINVTTDTDDTCINHTMMIHSRCMQARAANMK
jgi:hypothetical protein